MATLTRRQQAIYEFIARQVRLQGIPPTLMEIATAFGLSSAAGVSDHLKAIERKGYIRRRPGASRGIELARHGGGPPRRSVQVPVVGEVPGRTRSTGSGEQLLLDGSVLVGEAFAVRATGDLQPLGILEGDHLIVDTGAPVAAGDLVLGKQGARVVLLQASGEGRRLHTVLGRLAARRDVELLGRVVTVLRMMTRPLRLPGKRQ